MKTKNVLFSAITALTAAGVAVYWRYKNQQSKVDYVSCPIDSNPFVNDTIQPEMNSACTFLFTIDPQGKVLVLVGQQDPDKAQKNFNVVDVSGGRRVGTETLLQTADREKNEETGIENIHTTLLPNKVIKLYEEDGVKKAKVVFLRYFRFEDYVEQQKLFVDRSRRVIQSVAQKFEWRRFGLVADFFDQIAKPNPEYPEMPVLKVDHISGWLNKDGISSEVLDDSNPVFHARKAISRLYNSIQMKQLIDNVIKEFRVKLYKQPLLGETTMRFKNIKKFAMDAVPEDIDVSKFTPEKFVGSNTFFVGEHNGVAYVAKVMDEKKFGKRAYHTTVAEEIARRLYEHTGINVVPGRVILNKETGVPYYVMPNMLTNGFAPGPFDNEIDAKIPGLYSAPAIIEEIQAGMLMAILTGNYDHIFKNYFWKNEDGAFTIALSDLVGTNGSKAGGKISALLRQITPLQFLIFMNQPATLTCSNEPFNRIIDFKALQQIEQSSKYDEAAHYEILKSAVRDPEALVLLAKQLEALTPDKIAEQVAASYAQLDGMDKRTFAEEIAWRQEILNEDVKKSTKEYNEALALVNDPAKAEAYKVAKALVKDKTHPEFEQNKEIVKKFEKAQKVIAANYTNSALLELAQQGLAEMSVFLVANPKCTIVDWHIATLQARRDSMLAFLFKLSTDLKSEQTATAASSPKSAKKYGM